MHQFFFLSLVDRNTVFLQNPDTEEQEQWRPTQTADQRKIVVILSSLENYAAI